MAFLDLHEHILEEFAGWAPRARVHGRNDGLTVLRNDAARQLWIDEQNERYKARRARARAVKRGARPPCPRCGAVVERDAALRPDGGRGPKVPTYCSRKCMRAAIFARWHAKHGAERNARRRAA